MRIWFDSQPVYREDFIVGASMGVVGDTKPTDGHKSKDLFFLVALGRRSYSINLTYRAKDKGE